MKIFEMLFSEEFFYTSIQLTIPILFAALAALISNKAGILNINIEGSMSVSALIGALISFFTQSYIWGILGGIGTGILMGILLSICTHKLKTSSVLTGVALNIFATGFVVFLMYSILGTKGDTTSAPSYAIPYIKIPYLKDIPIIGVLFEQNLLFYIAIISVISISTFLNKTKMGLLIKAVGYNPIAAKSVGISIEKIQLIALIIAGVFAGLGGVFLSMSYLSTYNSGMIAGRGFIGLAAEAMGAGQPLLTMIFAFIFGIVSAFAINAQTALNIPYELLNTLPYLMTILALVIYSISKLKKQKNSRRVK
ncbi:MAG TPA: ABC transporter permease [Bacilli bacterium]|jgi:simple sugar transport system permease protein|nr:ABC transporter permease [Bacilli bacterium]HOD61567.1 ABC transporter permease [Bacilli bacterium]HOH61828.1 ABC transporter permease [Bacilli bacterium]HPB49066.1 ABC transporter permease [Bacilli bacterium]HPM15225.1 ABC transporter permease [Bacilli bacterium]